MILLNQIDGYNREPSACRFCNRTRQQHRTIVFSCPSPDRKWTPAQPWLIMARMRIRLGDNRRWLPDDDRTYYRKWVTGQDPE